MTSTEAEARLNPRRITPLKILAPQWLLIIVTVALLLFGLVMVFSASAVVGLANDKIQDSFYYFKNQLIWVGLGVVGLVLAAAIPYHVWKTKFAWVVWAVLIAFLVATLVLGNEQDGGKRWIDIFGFNFQPSEFAKIACMLVATSLIVQLHEHRMSWPLLAKGFTAIGLPAVLIMLQPDLGTLLIMIVGILAVAWFGELRGRAVVIGLVLIVFVGVASIALAGFRQDRIASFLNPWSDPLGSGYQIINSFYAFGDGGLFGVGLGMSHQKFSYLYGAQNDFIFAIIGEELGLVGALAVVALFVVFVLVAFRVGRNAPDLFGRVIACSAGTLIGAQAFLNILCTIGLAPITGKPLPFISAGGTSMIATLILVGLILSVSLRSHVPSEAERRRDDLLILDGGSAKDGAKTRGGEGTAAQSGAGARVGAGTGARVGAATAARSRDGAKAGRDMPASAPTALPRLRVLSQPKRKAPTTKAPSQPVAAKAPSQPVDLAAVRAQQQRRATNPSLRLSPARYQRTSQDSRR